jgi:hypothetical protein
MPEFTKEEEDLLEATIKDEMLHEVTKSIENSLQRYVGQPTQAVRDVLMQPGSAALSGMYHSIDTRLNECSINGRPDIKEIPLEQMPLYINDRNLRTRMTANWRLKISK